jgi:hypothetical protein
VSFTECRECRKPPKAKPNETIFVSDDELAHLPQFELIHELSESRALVVETATVSSIHSSGW